MINEKADAIRGILHREGFDVSPDIILEILHAIEKKRSAVYQPGDFVEFYYGMGEMGFGEVLEVIADQYRVRTYQNGQPTNYTHVVTDGDMRGLSTIEKSIEWEIERNRPQ